VGQSQLNIISHEEADLELNALTNGKPAKGVSDERRDMHGRTL